MPIRTLDGAVVGSFCAWDTRPLEIGDEHLAGFEDLAGEIAGQLVLTRIAATPEHASSRDSLTGAVGRLVLSDRMAQAFARQRRHNSDVLVAVIDVDQFKQINDTHGQDAGDEVLVTIAQRLVDCTRPEDTVARLGDDEFAVVAEMLPSAVMPASGFVGRLEAALAELVVFAGESRSVGVSVGAGFAAPGDNLGAKRSRAPTSRCTRARPLARPWRARRGNHALLLRATPGVGPHTVSKLLGENNGPRRRPPSAPIVSSYE